jgi:hypothetical protein
MIKMNNEKFDFNECLSTDTIELLKKCILDKNNITEEILNELIESSYSDGYYTGYHDGFDEGNNYV